MDINEIKKGLQKPGKTQRGLAKAMGVDNSAVSRMLKGEREIRAREIAVIRGYLESSDDAVPSPDRNEPLTPRDVRELISPHDFSTFPQDVPIMGVTVGGSDGDFLINVGDPVDYAKRTPAISRSRSVFALYVQGTSMSRWRDPGNLVYVDPIRPAKPGDRVVVECKPEKDGEGHPAFLKELVSKSPTKLKLRQYNPDTTMEIALSRVLHIRRVIEWEELLGI